MLYRIIGSVIILMLTVLAYFVIVSQETASVSQPVQQNQTEDFKSFKMQ